MKANTEVKTETGSLHPGGFGFMQPDPVQYGAQQKCEHGIITYPPSAASRCADCSPMTEEEKKIIRESSKKSEDELEGEFGNSHMVKQ